MSDLPPVLREVVRQEATRRRLPLPLVYGICRAESSNDPAAWRVEPPYRYLVDVRTRKPFRELTRAEIASETAPADFPYLRGLSSRNTEWWGQQASWGPMQVMGAVAREYGFDGHFPDLCGRNGIVFGTAHLARLRDRFLEKHGWEGVAAAYNAGSPRYTAEGELVNVGYVEHVTAAGGFNFEEASV